MRDGTDDSNEVTTVKVKRDTWQRLNKLKEPGDSFDDVIQRVLQAADQGEATGMMPETAD